MIDHDRVIAHDAALIEALPRSDLSVRHYRPGGTSAVRHVRSVILLQSQTIMIAPSVLTAYGSRCVMRLPTTVRTRS